MLARHVNAAVRRARWRRGLGASAAGSVLLAMGLFWLRPSSTPAEFRPGSTVVLRPVRQALPDGSMIELKENAVVTEQFAADVRRVILRSGEAHFTVFSDPARPFVVVAGGIEVRAVGTSFTVGLGPQAVDVVVTEGRVAVEQPALAPLQPSSPLAHLDAGHRVVVARGMAAATAPAEIVAFTPLEMNERLSWRVPRLEFSSTPLREAIPIFNRHGHIQFVLDPALGALQLSGFLRADNTAALLRLLKDEFGIEAERREERIFLRRG